MRTFSFLVLGLSIGLTSFAHAAIWELDPSHSSVEFSVRHMMVSTVKGQFEKIKGTVEIDDKDLTKSSVDITIDMASINTRDAKRDGHLRSPDFFDTAKFPTATFKSTKVEKAGKGKLKVTGDLTMHGVTKPVVLQVEGPTASQKSPFGTTLRGFMAKGKINRKDWGVDWNKPLETVGGLMVGNDVTLEVNGELVEKVAPAAAAKPEPAKPAAK
jgi:polyisoprenoid-binding protein YceI